MRRIFRNISLFFENLADIVRGKKLLIWILFIAITVFSILGLPRTKFDMTIEGWFTADDPVLIAMDEFKAQFGSNEGIYIVYQPIDGNVFSAKSLETIKGIQNEILDAKYKVDTSGTSMLKHIININTIINAPILKVDGDLLISKKLVGKTIPTNQKELEEIRKTAEEQKSFPMLFFSKDLKYGGILIETDFGTERLDSESGSAKDSLVKSSKSEELDLEMDNTEGKISEMPKEERVRFKRANLSELVPLMQEIYSIMDKPVYKNHIDYYAVGNAPMAYEQQNIYSREGGPIYLGLLIIIATMLWLLARSWSAVIWSLIIVIVSNIWTIGIFGWFDVEVTIFLMLTIMLTLTIGVCDSAHIFSGYLFFRNKGDDRWTSIQKVFKSSNKAIILTAFTNMLGMLTCLIMPIPRIQVFGLMSAVGVACACIITLFLLPLMLDAWAPKVDDDTKKRKLSFALSRYVPNFSLFLQKGLNKILFLVQLSPITIISIFLVILGITIYGSTKLNVDTNIATQFDEDSPFRKAVDIIDKEMMGSLNMELYLDLKKSNAFENPVVLNEIDALQRKLEQKYSKLVVRTSSLVEIVKDANQTLNEGKKEMYAIPSDPKVLSQTLFMFNMANPEDRKKQVSDDYSKTHISIQLYNVGSNEYMKTYDLMQKDIDETVAVLKHEYPNLVISITGTLPINMRFVQIIASNGLQNILSALATITIVLIFVFGSIQGGLLAIVPNLIPSLLTYGLLGLTGGSVDVDILMLLPVVVGISVDSTVHFLSHYRDEVKICGDIKKALQGTINEVGQATVFSSLILGLGFSVLSFSAMVGTANVGIFGTLAIGVGLFCNILLLPALIIVFKPKF